jgi:hypothetical protein
MSEGSKDEDEINAKVKFFSLMAINLLTSIMGFKPQLESPQEIL